jgi:trehalose 6-phosphate phosphatase
VIPILSPAATDVLSRIALDRTLLAFDFDGTLAPIVADRDAANMRVSTRALFRTAALLYPCAVVSGRTRKDVAARVRDIPLVAVVGNHGAEPGFGPVDLAIAARVSRWRPVLGDLVARGVDVEDKRFSLALHYRSAASWPDAERAIDQAVRRLDGARVIRGQALVNVIPEEAPTKGDAMRALCDRLGARVAVYVGDDRTDEDAFETPVASLSIRVGDSASSAARYFVPGQEEVDDLLRALIATRTAQDGLGGRWRSLVRAVGL